MRLAWGAEPRRGVTPEAIRYYEREGVIPAAERSGAGRYRRYGPADANRLRFVRRARDLGFSLDHVREILALAGGSPEEPCENVNVVARAHVELIEGKLAQLTALREELSRLIGGCGREVAIGECALLSALSGHDALGARQ